MTGLAFRLRVSTPGVHTLFLRWTGGDTVGGGDSLYATLYDAQDRLVPAAHTPPRPPLQPHNACTPQQHSVHTSPTDGVWTVCGIDLVAGLPTLKPRQTSITQPPGRFAVSPRGLEPNAMLRPRAVDRAAIDSLRW
jgi:hypothetical protein